MNIPTEIFHYTTNQGLLGILSTKSIWLSGGWNLNDSNEGKVFVKHLRSYAGESPIESIVAELSKLETYVACFCRHGDLLSQWRGYADDGRGISIGINTSEIISAIKGSHECLLREVSYADKVDELPEKIVKTLKALLSHHGSPSEGQLNSISHDIWSVKNAAFREEHEFRLTLSSRDRAEKISFNGTAVAKLSHRAVNSGIREFYEFSFGDRFSNLISKITLGPKNDTYPDVLTTPKVKWA